MNGLCGEWTMSTTQVLAVEAASVAVTVTVVVDIDAVNVVGPFVSCE